jgi:hypothetical protein
VRALEAMNGKRDEGSSMDRMLVSDVLELIFIHQRISPGTC